jgi:hypothetical protein
MYWARSQLVERAIVVFHLLVKSRFVFRGGHNAAPSCDPVLATHNLGENPYCRSANVNSELPAATATYCRPPTE